MSYSHHKKVFKQLKAKPVKLLKFKKHNAPKERKFGTILKRCRKSLELKLRTSSPRGRPHAR